MKLRTDKDILQFLGMGLGIVALGDHPALIFSCKSGRDIYYERNFDYSDGLNSCHKTKRFFYAG